MTHTELKQLRTLLFLDVNEAAKWIGKCEPRTWQRWEKGDRSIPLDVKQTISMLALTRRDLIQHEPSGPNAMYEYYEHYEDFKALTAATVLQWRLAQSVATELLCQQAAEQWREEETI